MIIRGKAQLHLFSHSYETYRSAVRPLLIALGITVLVGHCNKNRQQKDHVSVWLEVRWTTQSGPGCPRLGWLALHRRMIELSSCLFSSHCEDGCGAKRFLRQASSPCVRLARLCQFRDGVSSRVRSAPVLGRTQDAVQSYANVARQRLDRGSYRH
jgi:hypothetical protein